MLKRHAIYTRSARAWQLLALWEETATKFVKVMPKDYRRVLEALREAETKGLVGDEALIGMRLLAGHELRIAVVPGGGVEITPLP